MLFVNARQASRTATSFQKPNSLLVVHRTIMSSARAQSAGTKPTTGKQPADAPTKPSPSASVVLLAPLNKRTKDGYDYRVLLLKRNAKSSTFVSAHVFPGGNVDPIDRDDKAWGPFFPETKNLSPEKAREQQMRLCAVRETFEESGVLLLEGQGRGRERWAQINENDRRSWRDKVHASGASFVELFNLLSGNDAAKTRPALSSLQPRGNWITPAGLKRRFDTMFYITVLPPSSAPKDVAALDTVHADHVATADNGETISADWLTPYESVQRTLLHTGALSVGKPSPPDALILFPPQFYLLAELIPYKSWRDVLSKTDKDLSGNPLVVPRAVRAYEPEIRPVKDVLGYDRAATVLYGDPEHSKTDRTTCEPTDRHRTYVLVPDRSKGPGAPQPGLTVMGVHRQGMGRLLGDGWPDLKEGDVGESAGSERSRL